MLGTLRGMRRVLLACAAFASLVACNSDESTPAPSRAADTATTATTSGDAEERTAADVIDTLKAKGLPVGEVRVFTASDDPNQQLGRPGGYTSKASWHDTRLERDDDFDIVAGGSIEVFETEADATTRFGYVDGITRGNAMLNEYHWVVGRVFLRLSKAFTPEQAEAYRAAL